MSSKNNTTHLLTQNSNDTPEIIAAVYGCDLIILVQYFIIYKYIRITILCINLHKSLSL